jgi:hypothetical protein
MSEIKILLLATWKAYNCDTTKDEMEVETEPNVYEQYEEYVKQVKWKNRMIYLLKLMMTRMLM